MRPASTWRGGSACPHANRTRTTHAARHRMVRRRMADARAARHAGPRPVIACRFNGGVHERVSLRLARRGIARGPGPRRRDLPVAVPAEGARTGGLPLALV